jgi:uncharacterized protein
LVSEQLPSRNQAVEFLKQSGCPKNVIRHCRVVAELAREIAQECQKKGLTVNVGLVEIGALMHDIGRSRTHTVNHAVMGAEIARSFGLPEPVLSIIKRHVGGGITSSEARRLGWPRGVYVPQTLEEKIVCYSDKLIEGSQRVPFEKTLKSFSNDMPMPAVRRIQKLHDEMIRLIGDSQCLP